MIVIGVNSKSGKTTALNYFGDESFEPSVKTWRWGPRESFAYLYTLCGRGDPIMTDEQFKRATPGGIHDISNEWEPSWPYGSDQEDFDGTYKNYWVVEGELEGKTAQEMMDECIERFHGFVNNHAETVYNYLSTKGQIIEIENDAIWFALAVWSIKNNRLSDIQCWTIERTNEQMFKEHKEIARKNGFLTGEGTFVNYNSGEKYPNQSVKKPPKMTDADIQRIIDWRDKVWSGFYSAEVDTLSDLLIPGKMVGGEIKDDNWRRGSMYIDWNNIRHIDNSGSIEQLHKNLKTAFDEYNSKYGI